MKNTTKEQFSAFIDGETSEFEELSLSRSLSQGEDFIDSWTSYLKIRGATSVRDPLNPEDHRKLYEEISNSIYADETHLMRSKRPENKRNQHTFARKCQQARLHVRMHAPHAHAHGHAPPPAHSFAHGGHYLHTAV